MLGTCISIAIVAGGIYIISRTTSFLSSATSFSMIECVAFASLISSTDPVSTLAVFQSLRVDPTLFYLVFGESVLNDAIAITVSSSSSAFNFYLTSCYLVLHFLVLIGSFHYHVGMFFMIACSTLTYLFKANFYLTTFLLAISLNYLLTYSHI